MNIFIIYHSTHGNTQLITYSIAEILRDKGSIHLITEDELNYVEMQREDLVIVGSPIYRHSAITTVKDLLEYIPDDKIQKMRIAAFDIHHQKAIKNSESPKNKISRDLQTYGVNLVVPPESFYVVGPTGPLKDGELERAKEWAKVIAEHIGVNQF